MQLCGISQWGFISLTSVPQLRQCRQESENRDIGASDCLSNKASFVFVFCGLQHCRSSSLSLSVVSVTAKGAVMQWHSPIS